jgi:O-antigen ligase
MGLVVVMVGKQKLRKLFLIGIAAFAIFHVMPDQYKARFETAGTDGTSQARLKYWARGLEMYQDHSVLGIGYNNWIRYYSENYPGESLRKDHQEVAHSTPITVLAEMGTLGFVFFYGMALATIVTNIRTMRAVKGSQDKIWYFLAFGLNIGLIGFLVASSFVTEHEFPFLFVHASLSAALFGICAPRQQTKRRRRIAGRPTVTDASVKA